MLTWSILTGTVTCYILFMIGKPKYSQHGIRRSISVGFVHKHHLVVGVWKSSTKKLFIETKYL